MTPDLYNYQAENPFLKKILLPCRIIARMKYTRSWARH